ncbi:MAG: DUF2189 domain-containing protein [Alphaproteobacteria bacterium]|nr:DUF2189 domain-containing protein [Alphaproteobacteria bacterium]
MANAASASPENAPTAPITLKKIPLDRPWSWLAKGFSDLRRAPVVSLGYGIIFAVAGYLLIASLWAVGWLYLTLPLAAGFMIVGPLFAVGLYEASRRLQAGEPVTFAATLGAWKRNAGQIGLMGVALLLLMFAWLRLAALIFMLFFGLEPPSLDTLVQQTVLSADALPFLIIGTAIGAVLSVIAFAISVISIPLLLDHPEANVFTAITTSIDAVKTNPAAMLFWAVLIVLFAGAGLVTLLLGLIITLPLIGHASWHAYQDLTGKGD